MSISCLLNKEFFVAIEILACVMYLSLVFRVSAELADSLYKDFVFIV